MSAICRIGDIGVGMCSHPSHFPVLPFPYTTAISMGAATVTTNGLGTAIMGSVGVSTCGHPTTAMIGSVTVMAEAGGVHRLGDTGANFGPYAMTLGSPNTMSGA